MDLDRDIVRIFALVLSSNSRVTEIRASDIGDTSTIERTFSFIDFDENIVEITIHRN